MNRKIVLIEDDALMRRSMAYNLEQAGYQIMTAANAEDGLALIHNSPPDLVILDIGLPEMDGLDAIKRIKEAHRIPVIFVTARRRNLDEVVGLEMGADDYVTKPFDVDVLLAHIKAVLRRYESMTDYQIAVHHESISLGDLTVDPVNHLASLRGDPLTLSPREFNLLYLLISEPNRLFTTNELLAQIWGAEFLGEPQVVYVHIRWLREKIEKDPGHPTRILTIRGVGYKYVGGE
jgi:DNA-binding response OmpR family regulator